MMFSKHIINNSSFINIKEGDLSQNNIINFGGGLNESNAFRRINRNFINDYPSDINSILSANNYLDKKMGITSMPQIIRQLKPNKDLFSQKLLWGFMPGDWGQEIFAEDEKVKD